MNMVPMMLGTGELIIILVIAVLLFGGSRLAGVGKASGRAIREFREETKEIRDEKQAEQLAAQQVQQPVQTQPVVQQAEVVQPQVVQEPQVSQPAPNTETNN